MGEVRYVLVPGLTGPGRFLLQGQPVHSLQPSAPVHTPLGGPGRSLYKGTWKSSTLSSRFFEVSPDLIRSLPFWDVEVFASLVEALSYKSYDIAVECLTLGKDVLPAMGREREAFLAMCRALSDGNWREVKSCFEVAPKALQQVDEGQTSRFLKLGERLTKVGIRDTSRFLTDGSQALSQIPTGSQAHILDLCEGLLAVTPEAVPCFPQEPGQRDAPGYPEPAGYLVPPWRPTTKGQSGKAASPSSRWNPTPPSHCWKLFPPAWSLTGLRGLYACTAVPCPVLPIEVMNTQELVRRNIGWVDEDTASTDGTKVFLPPVVDHYQDKSQNFSWFKVVATHQVGHLEFGSFSYDFSKPATQFEEERRYSLERERGAQQISDDVLLGEMEPDGQMRAYTDIGRFLSLFDNRRLAFDIFTVLEDCRLDYRIKAEYPGHPPNCDRCAVGYTVPPTGGRGPAPAGGAG